MYDSILSEFQRTYEDVLQSVGHLVVLGQIVGGLGALVSISVMVWVSMVRSEPLDFFRLLRPFLLGILIMGFPQMVRALNALLDVPVRITASVSDARAEELTRLENSVSTLRDTIDAIRIRQVEEAVEESLGQGVMADAIKPIARAVSKVGMMFSGGGLLHGVKWLLGKLLYLVNHAAILLINGLRVFHLSLLVLLGPLIFGIAIWHGLNGGALLWLQRYIQIYMWLPVCHLVKFFLDSIFIIMLRHDVSELERTIGFLRGGVKYADLDSFGWNGGTQLMMYVLGILCWLSVPSIAALVVEAGGGMSGVQGAMGRGAGNVRKGYAWVRGKLSPKKS